MKLQSPWQLAHVKQWSALTGNLQAEVVIVGTGISGVMSLYTLLMQMV